MDIFSGRADSSSTNMASIVLAGAPARCDHNLPDYQLPLPSRPSTTWESSLDVATCTLNIGDNKVSYYPFRLTKSEQGILCALTYLSVISVTVDPRRAATQVVPFTV